MPKLFLLVELNNQDAEEAANIAADIEEIFDLTGEVRGHVHGPFTSNDIQFPDTPIEEDEDEDERETEDIE